MSGCVLTVALSQVAVAATTFEDDYTLELEARAYPSGSLAENKFDSSYALRFEPEFRLSANQGNTIFTLMPFGRWDSEDENRTHGDIREFNILHVNGQWETLFGFSKVFWGVAESNHLVDIINQTDVLEGIDGEDKLGQQMLRLSRSYDQNTLTAFILPGFREREFLSSDNPLSLPFEVNNDAVYESSRGDDHTDYAIRFSGYRGIVDYGLSWFHGTSREPDFIPDQDGGFRPLYSQIDQIGLDLQVTSGAWLWKLEMIRRLFNHDNILSLDDFTAWVGGFEYSIYGLKDNLFDLGLLLEYHQDQRDDPARVTFQNDLFVATRLGFLDTNSSELLQACSSIWMTTPPVLELKVIDGFSITPGSASNYKPFQTLIHKPEF